MNAEFSIGTTRIQTPRLLLRSFEQADLHDFNSYAKIEGVGEMAGWKHHESIEESQKILDLFIKEDKCFALVDRATNHVIGSLGVDENHIRIPNYEHLPTRCIGYVLSKTYWGKGLMPEAVHAVIDYLFTHTEIELLTIEHFCQNDQSRRVIEKCGFQYRRDGKYTASALHTAFDCKQYDLLKSDYLANQI